MYKSFIVALCATVAFAEDRYLDHELSTKEEGLILWRPFYQQYVDSLFSSTDEPVANYDSERHICWFQWRVEQPFAGIDDRYSLAVTHNCPESLIRDIVFDLSYDDAQGAHIVRDYDTAAVTDTGVKGIVVRAKTAAGDGDHQDFGVLLPKDGEPVWTYTYYVRV